MGVNTVSLITIFLLSFIEFHTDILGLDSHANQPQLLRSGSPLQINVNFDQHDLFQVTNQREVSSKPITAHAQQSQLIANAAIHVPDLPDEIHKNIPDLWQAIVPSSWRLENNLITVKFNEQNSELISGNAWIQDVEAIDDNKLLIQGGIKLTVKTLNLLSIDERTLTMTIELKDGY